MTAENLMPGAIPFGIAPPLHAPLRPFPLPMPAAPPAPSVARIVHFVLPNGEHRPAVIVRVWSEVCVNLSVFTDGENDAAYGQGADTVWETSRLLDPGATPGTWHWPERV